MQLTTSKSKNVIYVVEGVSGHYDDRMQWIVCAFTSLEEADTFVDDINAKMVVEIAKIRSEETSKNRYEFNRKLALAMIDYDEQGGTMCQNDEVIYSWNEVELR